MRAPQTPARGGRAPRRPGSSGSRLKALLRSDAAIAFLGILGATAMVLVVMFLISWQLYRERYGFSLGDYLDLFF